MKNINLQTAWNQIQPPDGLKEDILQKLQEAIRKEQTSTESVGDAPRPAPAAARWRIALGLAAAAAVLLVATLAWPPVLPASQPDPTVPAVATKSSSVRQDPPDESAAAQTDASQTEAQALAESLPLLDASSILQDKEGGGPCGILAFSADEIRSTLQDADPPAQLPVYQNPWAVQPPPSKSASNEKLQAELTRLAEPYNAGELEFYFYDVATSDAVFAFGERYDFYFCPTMQTFDVLLKEPQAFPEGLSLHPEPGKNQADILTRTFSRLCEQFPELIPYESYASTPPALHYGYDGSPHYKAPLICNDAAGTEAERFRQRTFERAEWIGFLPGYLSHTPGRPEYTDPEGTQAKNGSDQPDDYFYGISIKYYDLSEVAGNYPTITAEQAREQLLQGNFYTTETDRRAVDPEQIIGVQLVSNTGPRAEYFLPYYEFIVDCSDGKDWVAIENKAEGLRYYGSFYVPAVEPLYFKPNGNEIDIN